MSLNFNVDPYFDDFDSTKNYHRILFKPGYAVQARELTQGQTILQDQISKFGVGIYSDGSVITGGNITVDKNIVTAKLTSDSVDVIDNLVGMFAVGTNSNFVAEVVSVDDQNFYINTKPINNVMKFSSGETISLFANKLDALSYANDPVLLPIYTVTAITESTSTRQASGTYLNNALVMQTAYLSVGDTINYTYSNTAFYATVVSIIDQSNLTINQNLPIDFNNVPVTVTTVASAQSMEVNVDNGVWFTNGYFVSSTPTSIIPQSLSIYPSCVVGFEVIETTIDSYDDATLLDPAIGASNYQAPGADRYQISLELVSKPYVDSQTISNLTTNKFIELIRIDSGVITNIKNVPSFSTIGDAIARNVYDQSGNFIINPFKLNIPSSVLGQQTANVVAEISAGKAYINGYAVETLTPTKYQLEVARDVETKVYQDITTYYGNYIRAKQIKGSIPNFETIPSVELHNVAFGVASTNSLIGTAQLVNFSYDSNSGANTVHKVFLTNVAMSNNATVNIASIIIPGAGNNYTNIIFSANTIESTINDSNYDSLLFPLPQNNIANVTNIDYVTTRQYTTGTFTNGVYTINTNGTNEIFVGSSGPGGVVSPTEAQLNYILVTTSASGIYPAGKIIPLDGTQANVSIKIDNTAGLPQATFNIAGGFNGTATIYATISVASDAIKNKVVHANQYSVVSANATFTPIDIGYSDILNFNGIYLLGNTLPFMGYWNSSTSYSANNTVLYDDGTVYISTSNSNSANTPNTSSTWSAVQNDVGKFILDAGQRDTFYDHGSIINPYAPLGNMVVVFDYFSHSGGTGALTRNSYPIDYTYIPTYVSPVSGKSYSLRDTLDFRPRRQDNATTFQSHQIPAPFNNVFVDYGFYLSRVDKIVMNPNGQFKTIKGISSYTNPVPPADVNNTLTLFTLTYPAYTYNSSSIVINPTNLRRYTMADIGLLDRRITTLENYTSLSLLETHTTGMDVTDATGQNLLFKNGYLVDGFTSPSVVDTFNPDVVISIDPIQQICRPYGEQRSVAFDLDLTQGNFINVREGFQPSSNVNPLQQSKINNMLTINNDVVTFSYDEVPLVFQNVASEIINVNPFNVLNFVGSISLSPVSDIWYSTNTIPQISVVNNDQYAWQSAIQNIGIGSQWNQWQFNWTGQPTDTLIASGDTTQVSSDTTAITTAINTQGLQSALSGGLITVTSNQNIISSSIIPYCRSIPIDFVATGLTPYTQVFPYINNIAVSQYTNPKTFNGGIYYVDILNGGSGYSSGNSVPLTVTGNCTTQAVLTANVVNGVVANVNIISSGSGYAVPPVITLTTANTGAAVLSANTLAVSGAPLVTDINGSISGTIIIPNDDNIKIPTGTLNIILTDNAMNPPLAKSYASAPFYSMGTLDTVQTTVVSVRPPQASLIPPAPTPTYAPVINTGGSSDGVTVTQPPVTTPATTTVTIPGSSVTVNNPIPASSSTLGPYVSYGGHGAFETTITSSKVNNAGDIVTTTSTGWTNGVTTVITGSKSTVVGPATTTVYNPPTTITVPVSTGLQVTADTIGSDGTIDF